MMMPNGQLMSPPKCPFEQMTQSYLGITPQMTGC